MDVGMLIEFGRNWGWAGFLMMLVGMLGWNLVKIYKDRQEDRQKKLEDQTTATQELQSEFQKKLENESKQREESHKIILSEFAKMHESNNQLFVQVLKTNQEAFLNMSKEQEKRFQSTLTQELKRMEISNLECRKMNKEKFEQGDAFMQGLSATLNQLNIHLTIVSTWMKANGLLTPMDHASEIPVPPSHPIKRP